jgi:putative transposase
MLMQVDIGRALPTFIGRLHGLVSHTLNQRDGVRRRMWDNYWDSSIHSTSAYWTRFNYIHHNPVKHGYVSRMEEWMFSSYRWYLERHDAEWLADCFARYPIRDFTDSRDCF